MSNMTLSFMDEIKTRSSSRRRNSEICIAQRVEKEKDEPRHRLSDNHPSFLAVRTGKSRAQRAAPVTDEKTDREKEREEEEKRERKRERERESK